MSFSFGVVFVVDDFFDGPFQIQINFFFDVGFVGCFFGVYQIDSGASSIDTESGGDGFFEKHGDSGFVVGVEGMGLYAVLERVH